MNTLPNVKLAISFVAVVQMFLGFVFHFLLMYSINKDTASNFRFNQFNHHYCYD